ncbi:hypothetical protein MBLNU230_g4842t1 [Neophaeotheca triangularis]
MAEEDWESVGDEAGVDDQDLEELKAQVDEWSADSKETLHLEIHDGQNEVLQVFHPEWTYPIFGDEEAIFGYQGLDMQLSFASHNLEPRLRVKYDKKFEQQGDVAATDVEELMRDFLPPVAYEKTPRNSQDAYKWSPPGEQLHSYTKDDVNYEIWCASLSDQSARQILENVQILVPLFIEGGSALELDNEATTKRWKIYLLYANYNNSSASNPTLSQYELTGYATSYRVFTFPSRENPSQTDLDLFLPTTQGIDEFLPTNETTPTKDSSALATPLDLPSRERLSQFLILPPHHKQGHGFQLYKTMHAHLTSPNNIRELTIEDPNEEFDNLRDLSDLYLLRRTPVFQSLTLNPDILPTLLTSTSPIPTDTIIPLAPRQTLLQTSKIEQRQLDRLIEAQTLSSIPHTHRNRNRLTRKEKSTNVEDRKYFLWRLYVKKRLYLFNRDQLVQADLSERVEKLEAAVDGVQEGYVALLEKVEMMEEREGVAEGSSGGSGSASARGKRKRVVIDDEDGEGEDDGGDAKVGAVNGRGEKRVRS